MLYLFHIPLRNRQNCWLKVCTRAKARRVCVCVSNIFKDVTDNIYYAQEHACLIESRHPTICPYHIKGPT